MGKREMVIGIVALCALFFSASFIQASPDKRFDATTNTCRIFGFDTAWWGEGNKTFKQNCKSCHYRNNDKGAPFLYAESKSPRAWNRVFYKKYPACAKDGSWNIDLQQQLALNDFLYKYGADTYNAYDANDCG
ncbi:MAG: hypothetical protein H8E41_05085 [Desulfobulbaceae bacterium]|uniref:Cytochrome c domain-containing protein n=1 Tax=Candidatus Desulfobia pelagia TaxID=2841692 RepID=A0A8J6TFD3_9BACT|nr:hypothetical protein [Candidatus Desulfobia pelagia]